MQGFFGVVLGILVENGGKGCKALSKTLNFDSASLLPIGSRPLGSINVLIILIMATINEKVGKTIRKLREAKGWTQETLADEAGLHRAYIGQVERGEKNIGLQNLEKIANALEITIKDLF